MIKKNLILILSTIPLGMYTYDLYLQSLDKEFRMEMAISYNQYFSEDSMLLPLPTLKKVEGSYNQLKSAIKTRQQKFQTQYKVASSEAEKNKLIGEASVYVTEQLVNGVFPHWYGTVWSFDGYTAIPNKGEIGCSYFVSTTLLHAGFNLNRYKLAQQGPVSEATSLMLQGTPLRIDIGIDFNEFIPEVQKKCKDGLYFIGLGHSHVGYIYYIDQEVYFIQSSYGNSRSVVIDYAKESDILTGFGSFTLVPITTNEALMKRWLTGEEILVVKGKD